MNTNDAENDAESVTGNDADDAARGVGSEPDSGRELPTEPLPWWVEAHGGVVGDTVPLGSVDARQAAMPGAVPAGAASVTTAGRAVTDSMKSGEPDRTSFLRRHAVALSIAAAALAIVVVAGGTAWGVSAAVAGEAPPRPRR
ncbi:hypothetical protein ACRAWC_05085 [Leifsonia sp. L25]|uniref:hypothetical protein n=1 Tax=Actinomycetes TaxID=1760 RepID=UPI003D684CD2